MSHDKNVNINLENGFEWGFRVGCGLIAAVCAATAITVASCVMLSTAIIGFVVAIASSIP